MDPVFHRIAYAQAMAQQLLRPSALQLQVRSGVFLSGIRRIGKTTFLKQDLIPTLEQMGAVVIYADLWTDRSKSPTAIVHEAVRSSLALFSKFGSGALDRLKGLNLGVAGFSFGFQVDAVGKPGGAALAQVFTELVDLAKTDVVLVIDEVQQALGSEDGMNLLFALKAARDAVNTRPGTTGHFLFLGTGSHKSLVADMAMRRTQPFAGAMSVAYEPLDAEFVAWKHAQLATLSGVRLPAQEVMLQGFRTLGHRPESWLQALAQLQSLPESPDLAFPIICSTLAASSAASEMAAVDALGQLAEVVFDRIASGDADGVSGLFSNEAVRLYESRLGVPVDIPQVQAMLDRLIAANLVQRLSHGVYAVADPLVRQAWQQRQALNPLNPP